MIYFFIYIMGYVIAYNLNKKDTIQTFNEWTVGDRKFSLFISLFSWVTVVEEIITGWGKGLSRNGNNKKASW